MVSPIPLSYPIAPTAYTVRDLSLMSVAARKKNKHHKHPQQSASAGLTRKKDVLKRKVTVPPPVPELGKRKERDVDQRPVETVKSRHARIKEEAVRRGNDEEWARMLVDYQEASEDFGAFVSYFRALVAAERNCETILRAEKQLIGESSIAPAARRLQSAKLGTISPSVVSHSRQCFECPRLASNRQLVDVDRKVFDRLLTHLEKRQLNERKVLEKMKNMEARHQSFLLDMISSMSAVEKTNAIHMREITHLRGGLARRVQRSPAVLIPRTPIENGWTLPREQPFVRDPSKQTPFTGRPVEETRYDLTKKEKRDGSPPPKKKQKRGTRK